MKSKEGVGVEQVFNVPAGFRLTGVSCGIKTRPGVEDLTLVVSDDLAVAAGVYTQNLVRAAPVEWDRLHTPSAQIRAVVANSGNANACTGEQGWRDTVEMARLAAEVCGAATDQVLVLSTGVIGDPLPMDKIRQGIRLAADSLAADAAALRRAARGILTTDRAEKMAVRCMTVQGIPISLVGFAKGAGMIGPNMATMLALLLTDARLRPDDAQRVLQRAVDASFNCISVEGHTSTNDTVLLLASGRAPVETLQGQDLERFGDVLVDLCVELARMIPDDGEGASHLITIRVAGCRTRQEARQVARTIAASPLVKCAIAGGGPYWGRILSAAGYAGVPFDVQRARVAIQGIPMFEAGQPVAFDPAEASRRIQQSREVQIDLELQEGPESITFWTSDLTVEYVRFNADYRT